MFHSLISCRRNVGMGSPPSGRHGMHRDRASGYPPVASPRYRTRKPAAPATKSCFPAFANSGTGEAELIPLALTAGRSRREMR